MRNRRNGGVPFAALTLLGLLATSGRAEGLFAVPVLAEMGTPAPADVQGLPDAPPAEPTPRNVAVWMAERDLYAVKEVRERGIPLAMVLSGGYGPFSWEAHARSLEGIVARFDRAT